MESSRTGTDERWQNLRKELTEKADIFSKMPIQNSNTLSAYFTIAQRLFEQAREKETEKDFRLAYVLYKRYGLLVSRELPKHNAYHQVQYRRDRDEVRRRTEHVIARIQHVIHEIRLTLDDAVTASTEADPTSPPGSSGVSSTKGSNDLPKNTSATVLQLRELSDSLPPNALTAKERAALRTLELPREAYADSGADHRRVFNSTIHRTRPTKSTSPYEKLFRGLQPRTKQSIPRQYDDAGKAPKRIRAPPAEEDRQFRAELLRVQGMRVQDCKMDGNCLFRAVSHQMYGTQELHASIRQDVCAYMRSQSSRFKWLADPPTIASFQGYVTERERPVVAGIGVWGDHAEIIVLEELFDRPIEIYDPREGATRPRKTHVSGELPETFRCVTPIRLHYQGGNHYNSIVVVDRSICNDSERVPLPKRTQGVLRRFRQETMTNAA